MTIVETAVQALRRAQLKAQRAFPVAVMPQLDDVAVAVQLHSLDQEKGVAQVLVSVFAPPAVGGRACEDASLAACRALNAVEGVCQVKQTVYLKDEDLFCAEVYATFEGRETAEGWRPFEPPAAEE